MTSPPPEDRSSPRPAPASPGDCRKVRERLPWLMNGSLPAAEAREVLEHLRSCAKCREEQSEVRWAERLHSTHVEAELLTRLAAGDELPEAETLRAENHLAFCPLCREQLELARQSFELLEEKPRQLSTRLPAAPLALSPVASWERKWAVAATVLFAVTAGGWLLSRAGPEPRIAESSGAVAAAEEPSADVLVGDLFPEEMSLRGPNEERQGVATIDPLRSSVWLLSPGTATWPVPGTRVEVRLQAADGTPIWADSQARVSQHGDVALEIPGGWLPAGEFTVTVRLHAGASASTAQTLTYKLVAEPPSPTSTNGAQ